MNDFCLNHLLTIIFSLIKIILYAFNTLRSRLGASGAGTHKFPINFTSQQKIPLYSK